MNSFHEPLLALALLAGLLGFLAAVVVRRLTPRRTLQGITQQLQAELLAWRLFADQPGNFWRSLPRVLGLTLLRMVCLLPAVLLLLPIGLIVSAQLEMRFARRPLEMGESALVTLRLEEDAAVDFDSIKLDVAPPLEVKHGPLHDPDSGTIYWEVGVTDPSVSGTGEQPALEIHLAGASFSIPVRIANAEERLPGVIHCWSSRLADRLLFGCPRAWPENLPVREIALEYPPRTLTLAGQTVSWMMPFLVCLLCGYFVTRRLGY